MQSQPSQRCFHQQLGLWARDKHRRGDLKTKPEKFLPSGEIGQRLALFQAANQRRELGLLRGGKRCFGVG
jgi:hypothetical protein